MLIIFKNGKGIFLTRKQRFEIIEKYCQANNHNVVEYSMGLWDEKEKKNLDLFIEKYITEFASPDFYKFRFEGEELQEQILEVFYAFCKYSSNARMGRHVSQPIPKVHEHQKEAYMRSIQEEQGFFVPPYIHFNLRDTYEDKFYVLLYSQEGFLRKKQHLAQTYPIPVNEVECLEGELSRFIAHFKDNRDIAFSVGTDRKASVAYL